RGQQLAMGAASERFGTEAIEHLVSVTQLRARIHASTRAPQPLAVHQMGTCKLNGDATSLQMLDRLTVKSVGRLSVAQQRARPGQHAERPIRADSACPLFELAQCVGRNIECIASHSSLDQLDQVPTEETKILMLACALRSGERGIVASQSVVQHGCYVVRQTDGPSLTAFGRVSDAVLDQRRRVKLIATPCG